MLSNRTITNNNTVKYVVYNENTLGYMFTDDAGNKRLGTLHASILKGATHNSLSDPLYLTDKDMIRRATLKDFEAYRVSLPPDFLS